MKKTGFWTITGLVLIAAITCSCAPGKDQENSATVMETVNQVDAHARSKENWKPAVVDMAIYGGGQVRTGQASSARLELLEGVVRLAAESLFTVKESTSGEGRLKTVLFLEEGRLWAHLTTSQPHEFIVETAGAVAAVRDTHMCVNVTPDKTIQVSVAKGKVEVTAEGKTVTVTAGQQSIVKPGQPPSPPEPMSEEERGLWLTEGEAQAWNIEEWHRVDLTATPEPPAPTATLAPTPTPPEEPVTLRLALANEPSLDPALAADTASFQCGEALFLGLTDFDDKTLEAIPELAEKWEVSEEGLKWTFYMRKDIYWVQYDSASGRVEKQRPVTAHDVEYGVKRTLDPATASGGADLLYSIKGGEMFNAQTVTDPVPADTVGVKALDDFTIEFELVAPAAHFPGIAGMWPARPVPGEVIEEYGDQWIEPGNIWTNGPYLLDTWEDDNKVVMIKNPEHPDAANVQITHINWFVVEEASTALAMYENGELDVAGVPLQDLDRVRQDPVLSEELYVVPTGGTYYYGFNVTKPPVDNVHVRRALSYAIDRQKLIDTVLKGGQLPASSLAWPSIFSSPAEDADFEGIEFDPDMARQELELAGYPGGAGLPEMTLMHNTSEGHRAIAQFIQEQWKEHLGIEVDLASQEFVEFIQTVDEDPPQIFWLGWGPDYADAHNWVETYIWELEAFHSTKGANRIRWSSSEHDQLSEQAALETDPTRRKELYFRAEEILCVDEAGIIPIYHYTRVVLTKPYVERTFAPLGGNHIDKWKVHEHAVTPSAPPPSPTPTPEEEAAIHTLTDQMVTPTPTLAPTVTAVPPARAYVEEGMAHYVRGKPLLEAHEEGGEGDCEVAIGELWSAIEKCTMALELDPNDPYAFFCRGMSRVALKEQMKEARDDLRRALELGLEGENKTKAEERLAEVEKILTTPINVIMGDITFAEDFTEDGAPIGESQFFPGCVKEVWAQWTVSNQRGDENAYVKWFFMGELGCQHLTGVIETWWDWTGSGWIADEGACIEPGDYWVEVRIGDTILTAGGFEVGE